MYIWSIQRLKTVKLDRDLLMIEEDKLDKEFHLRVELR